LSSTTSASSSEQTPSFLQASPTFPTFIDALVLYLLLLHLTASVKPSTQFTFLFFLYDEPDPKIFVTFLFFLVSRISPQGGEICETLPRLEIASSQSQQVESASNHSRQLETASSYSISIPWTSPPFLATTLQISDTIKSSIPSSEVWHNGIKHPLADSTFHPLSTPWHFSCHFRFGICKATLFRFQFLFLSAITTLRSLSFLLFSLSHHKFLRKPEKSAKPYPA